MGMVSTPSIPSLWIRTLNITPPPPRENFFGPRFGYKNVLDCKSVGNCSLYVATKCINFSLHLFRSQSVIYTELSLSIKKGRVFLIGPRKSKISLTQICFTFPHFTWHTLLCAMYSQNNEDFPVFVQFYLYSFSLNSNLFI